MIKLGRNLFVYALIHSVKAPFASQKKTTLLLYSRLTTRDSQETRILSKFARNSIGPGYCQIKRFGSELSIWRKQV